MKLDRYYWIVFFFFSFLSGLSNAYCQVTIGSDLSPLEGTILDLKEFYQEGTLTNSTKGLLLPRVKLLSDNSLEGISGINNNDQAAKATAEANHIALTVYNTNECLEKGAGVYTWMGDKWERLDVYNPRLGEVTDIDNNTYKTLDFGPAGIWMAENLRTTRYADGTALSHQPGSSDIDLCQYFYPTYNPSNVVGGGNAQSLTLQPELGLLYNWNAASRSKKKANMTPGYTSEANLKEQTKIQGICPDGWHLPSDYEWNQLEKEIANNPHQYSSYFPDASWSAWNSSWESALTGGPSGRPDKQRDAKAHGNAMKTSCNTIAKIATPPEYYGKSKNVYNGGFNVIFAGSYNGITNKVVDYGTRARFWTSSLPGDDTPLSRVFLPDQAGVLRWQQDPRWAWSVRCVKD